MCSIKCDGFIIECVSEEEAREGLKSVKRKDESRYDD